MNKIRRILFYCFALFMIFFTYSCQRMSDPNPNYLYPTYTENEPDIKVRIAVNKTESRIFIEGTFEIRTYYTEDILGSGRGGLRGKIELDRSHFLIREQPFKLTRLRILSPNPIIINGTPYSNEIHLIRRDNGFDIINKVKLEQYLAGVLGSEMPITWPDDALKAQAIAARTYALYNMKINQSNDYHVESTTASQVFGGKSTNIRANRIIDITTGMIMVYDWKLFPAYFHSSSGGHTADASAVFKNYLPPLQGRKDGDSPKKPWSITLHNADLAKVLKNTRPNKRVGHILDLKIRSRTPSGRAQEIEIVHSRGSELYESNAFRLAIGAGKMKSTLCTIKNTRGGYVLRGNGFGHGVGMSQWGTLTKAKKQIDYRDILRYYYPGIEFIKVYKTAIL